MKVNSTRFSFEFHKRVQQANCLLFRPADRMMCRVFLPGKTMEEDEVYVFYANTRKKKMEWYPLPDPRAQLKAMAISRGLESFFFGHVRPVKKQA